MKMTICWFLVILILGCAVAQKIPKMNCHFSSSDFIRCVQKEAITFLPAIIKNGVPDKNIMSLDPTMVESPISVDVVIGPFNVHVTIQKSTLKGLAKTIFKEIRATKYHPPQAVEFTVTTQSPFLEITGIYNGKVMTIVDQGNFKLSLSNVATVTKVSGHMTNTTGKTHLTVDKVYVDPKIGDLKIVFSGASMLGSPALSVINNYWEMIHKNTWPLLEPQIEQIIKDKINTISNIISVEDVISG